MYLFSLFYPNIAYADFDSFLGNVNSQIVNPLIGFMFAIAITYFLWGLLKFLMNADSEEARTQGKTHMMYGIIGLTIMMGVWGILNLIVNTLNLEDEINPEQGVVELDDYNPKVNPLNTNGINSNSSGIPTNPNSGPTNQVDQVDFAPDNNAI